MISKAAFFLNQSDIFCASHPKKHETVTWEQILVGDVKASLVFLWSRKAGPLLSFALMKHPTFLTSSLDVAEIFLPVVFLFPSLSFYLYRVLAAAPWSCWWSLIFCKCPPCTARASRCSWWASPPAPAPLVPRWSTGRAPHRTAEMRARGHTGGEKETKRFKILLEHSDLTAIQTSSADPGDLQVSLIQEDRTASNVQLAMLNQALKT